MEVRCNATGASRKKLAEAIAQITGRDAKYIGAPTFAYEIGPFIVTRDGALEAPDDAEDIGKVLKGIAEAGFESEPAEKAAAEEGADPDDADEPAGFTVSVPLDEVNAANLTRLLDAKGGLIKKALGIDALPVEIKEDAVSFPWFNELPDADRVKACTHLISALCKMSRDQKKITASAKEVENEKYAFRCFLLRLGFIGPEYKTERKILLQNLSGSAAFKGGARHADAG